MPCYSKESYSFALEKDHRDLPKVFGPQDSDLPVLLHAVQYLHAAAVNRSAVSLSLSQSTVHLRGSTRSFKPCEFSKCRFTEHASNSQSTLNISRDTSTLPKCHRPQSQGFETAGFSEETHKRQRTCPYNSGSCSFEAIWFSRSLVDIDQTNAFKLEREYQHSVRWCEETSGPNDAKTLQAIVVLAYSYTVSGNYEAAKCLYRRLALASATVYGECHPATLMILRNLSALYQFQGNYREAASTLLQLLKFCEESSKASLTKSWRTMSSEVCPDVLEIQEALAINYDSMGQFADAEKLYLKVLAQQTRLYGKDNLQTLNTSKRLDRNLQLQKKVPPRVKTYDEVFFRRASTYPRTKESRTLPFPDLSLWTFGEQHCSAGTENAKRQQRNQLYWASTRKRTYSI